MKTPAKVTVVLLSVLLIAANKNDQETKADHFSWRLNVR